MTMIKPALNLPTAVSSPSGATAELTTLPSAQETFSVALIESPESPRSPERSPSRRLEGPDIHTSGARNRLRSDLRID